MMVAAVSMTLFFYFKPGNRPPSEDPEIRRGKPLDLAGALMFGGLYLLILVVVAYAHDQLGPKGILISSTVAGLSDLDAITLTVSKLAGISVEFNLAANALLLASVSNTLVKMAIGVWAGGKQLRKHLLLGYGVIFLAALAGFAMLAWIY